MQQRSGSPVARSAARPPCPARHRPAAAGQGCGAARQRPVFSILESMAPESLCIFPGVNCEHLGQTSTCARRFGRRRVQPRRRVSRIEQTGYNRIQKQEMGLASLGRAWEQTPTHINDVLNQGSQRGTIKSRFQANDLVQDTACGPDVRLEGELSSLAYFRTEVHGGSDDVTGSGPFVRQDFGDSKVAYFQDKVLCSKNVAAFQVSSSGIVRALEGEPLSSPVHDVHVVQVGEGADDLTKDQQGVQLRQRIGKAIEVLTQGAFLAVLHLDEELTIEAVAAVVGDDVLVLQDGEKLAFLEREPAFAATHAA